MSLITVIGGINIDIEGKPFENLKYEDSNPGTVSLSYGGVGRNIVENVARMGGETAMVSVIGDDHMGQGALAGLQRVGVDTSAVKAVEGRSSAIYLSILNDKNDMEVGICDMDIVDAITPGFLEERMSLLETSAVVALDGNLSSSTLKYAVERLQNARLFFDPVSGPKAVRAAKVIGYFDAIKPNIMEAEALLDMKIADKSDVKKAGNRFIDMGVGRVFITLNKEGVYYRDDLSEGFVKPVEVTVCSATGAGDSFSAAVLMGLANGISTKEMALYGTAAAAITMESPFAVNEKMNIKELKKYKEKIE